MTPELDKLQSRNHLQDARQEIANSLGLREQVCIEQTADAMDQVQAATARELAISNLDRSARWLREIEEALRRLDIGEYGTCLNCEEEIGAKRLRAVPWAQLCLRCQELADRSGCSQGENYAAEPLMSAA
jgi:DnaK suppressor protein